MRFADVAALVAINTIWGCSYVVSKIALADAPPYTLALLRFACAFVLMAPFAIGLARRAGFTAADYRALALLGLTGFALSYALVYQGTVFAPASDVALIVVAEPLFIIGFAAFMSSRPMPGRVVPAVIVAFAGVSLIAWRGADQRTALAAHVGGDALVVIGTALQAWYGVYGERVAARLEPISLTWASIGFGAAALLPLAGVEWAAGRHLALTANVWAAVAYLAIGCTFVGYLTWFFLVRRIDVRRLGVSLYIQPVVGVIAAALFLKEPVGWQTLLGGGLVIGGVALASLAPGSLETDSVPHELVVAERDRP